MYGVLVHGFWQTNPFRITEFHDGLHVEDAAFCLSDIENEGNDHHQRQEGFDISTENKNAGLQWGLPEGTGTYF